MPVAVLGAPPAGVGSGAADPVLLRVGALVWSAECPPYAPPPHLLPRPMPRPHTRSLCLTGEHGHRDPGVQQARVQGRHHRQEAEGAGRVGRGPPALLTCLELKTQSPLIPTRPQAGAETEARDLEAHGQPWPSPVPQCLCLACGRSSETVKLVVFRDPAPQGTTGAVGGSPWPPPSLPWGRVTPNKDTTCPSLWCLEQQESTGGK